MKTKLKTGLKTGLKTELKKKSKSDINTSDSASGSNPDKISILTHKFAIVAWSLWLLVAYILMFDAGTELLFLYTIYMMLGLFVLAKVHDDIFSPPGLIVLVGFLAFGYTIPVFTAGLMDGSDISSNVLFTGDASTNDLVMFRVLVIFLTVQIGFIVGYSLPLYHLIPIKKIIGVSRKTRDATVFSFVLVMLAVVVAGFIRITFHLGEAGIQPSIPFPGFFQYILYNGITIICLWYLAQAIRRGWLYTFLGFLPMLGVAATQVLLSWRGGIMHVVIMVFFLFWYNQTQYKKKSTNIVIWAICLAVLVPVFIEAGNSIRTEKQGGGKDFSAQHRSFIMRVLNRAQGTSRLVVIVNDIGPLTLTNNFKIFDLASQGLSTTAYIDRKLYGVVPGQSHSMGTSGPGGPYVGMGLLGVISAYLILGVFFRSSYECMKVTDKDNTLGIVWNTIIAFMLFSLLTENFGIGRLKTIIALAGLMYVFSKIMLLQKERKE